MKVLGRCLERDLAEARDALLELSKVCRTLVCADPGVVKLLVDRVRDDPQVVSVLAELLVDSGAARQLVEGGGVPAVVLCFLETGDGCCVECLEKICEDGHGRAVADAGGIGERAHALKIQRKERSATMLHEHLLLCSQRSRFARRRRGAHQVPRRDQERRHGPAGGEGARGRGSGVPRRLGRGIGG